MTTATATRILALVSLTLAALPAQDPKDPPPWWGVQDEDTVSLHWDFNNQANPLQPTQQVLPSWYAPLPSPAMFTNSPNITWLANVNGQAGVMGFTGPGTGTISALIDNDPRPFWIKIFFLQFDSFGTGGSTVLGEVDKDLAKYQRSIISEFSEVLPNGWTRTTIGMYLIPQPIDEKATWTLNEVANNSVAIDNVFINSKCVKPPPDEKGKALGEKDFASLNINLTAATAGADCTAVAATEDTAGNLTYWVAGRTGAVDSVFRLNQTGVQVGAAVPLPTAVASLNGASDLTVARLPIATTVRRDFVFGLLDRRQANGTILITAIDSVTASIVPARNVLANNIIGPPPLGLAFSRHGDLGNGTFWISDQAGGVTEIDLGGNILRQLTPANNGTPLGIVGAAYDDKTNLFYWFSQAPRATPLGPTQINGFVHDGYSLQPTGIEFFADLNLPNPGGIPGGVAGGLEIIRRANGDFRLLCVQRTGLLSHLTVLNGPYQFGWSLLGRCGMRNGPPIEGSPFTVTLRGVPRASNAILFIGFDNATSQGVLLPLPLAGVGLDESTLLIDPLLSRPILPVANGGAADTFPIPLGFRGVPLYFQWLVFDPTVQNGMAASQGGETVIY